MLYITCNIQFIKDMFTLQDIGRRGELLSLRAIVRRANDYSIN